MSMIHAAFDASMQNPHGVMAIAGYIADADDWLIVERKWNACLALNGLERFRLTEVFDRFGKEGGLKCAAEFATVLENSNLRCVSALLLDTDWSRLDRDSEYRKVYPRKQHACLDLLLVTLAQEADLEFKGEQIAVVFDNDYDSMKLAGGVYDAWRARTGHRGFGLVAWVKGTVDWDVAPLQCADLAAGLLRQDPFTREMLKPSAHRNYRNIVGPFDGLARKAMPRSRGALWSIDLANEAEAMLKKFRAGG